ncbi:MAG TPA: DNA translocase FtsK 4TM domain-containing protein [Candidatus Paceibacterota bacterium]|nr:DNA translocase FtsK 4TM domain-containing protein [Candidatus Paceibacterota bacterium]
MAKKKKKKRNPDDDSSSFDIGISQETRNSIYGILCFLIVAISILAFMGRAGTAGEYLDSAARSLFGWGFFIVPVAFGMLGIAFIKSIHRQIATSAVVGTLLFVLSVLGVFYSLGEGDTAQRIIQGGYLGVAFGYPLYTFIGFIASMVVLVGLVVVSVLLALDVSLAGLLFRRQDEGELPLPDKAKGDDDLKELVVTKGGKPVQDEAPAPAKPVKPAKGADEESFVVRHFKAGNWKLPPLDFLAEDEETATTGDINATASIIKRTLQNFGIDVEMGEVSVGPTVTQFTVRPAVGVKLARITALNQDLALALAAHPIRIEAPIPGKSLVGIEVPNKKVAIVGLRNMLQGEEYQKAKYVLPLALGRDVAGKGVYGALDRMPHLLIAGTTGSGKSVSIHAAILSMLYKYSPDMLKLILVDPKKVEMPLYEGIPHLITPVITDNKKVLGALKWVVSEMDRRYSKLSEAKVRDIMSYNERASKKDDPFMPFIVVVIDELADLMATYGRDVEAAIVRLAQMARAVGIHLILATQRPSVNVITGLIKANISSRVALRVISQVDSRTILDMSGAEKLLGYGDMLYVTGESAAVRRLQGPLVTSKEIEKVVKFIKTQAEELELDTEDGTMQVDLDGPSGGGGGGIGGDEDVDDDKYGEAKELVIQMQKASASLLQRRLGLGYARAARMLDILESKGIVGPGDGAKPRQVYVNREGELVGGPGLQGATGVHADTDEAEATEE